MKFTEEQIEKVSALRTELVEKVNIFENGVEYAIRIFDVPKEKRGEYTWLRYITDRIDELMIEEMKIGETDISDWDEANFFVFLGGYFERIYAAVEKGDEKIHPYFYSMIGVYKKHIMDVLKK